MKRVMLSIMLIILLLLLCPVVYAGWGKYMVQFSSYVNTTTSNSEVKFSGKSASILGRVIISTGTAGMIYFYDSQTSTATVGLVTEIDTSIKATYPYFIWLSSGLIIRNESGASITVTGNRKR